MKTLATALTIAAFAGYLGSATKALDQVQKIQSERQAQIKKAGLTAH